MYVSGNYKQNILSSIALLVGILLVIFVVLAGYYYAKDKKEHALLSQANDYHLYIKQHSTELMDEVTLLRLWLRDKVIVANKNSSKPIDYAEVSLLARLSSFQYEINNHVGGIIRTQKQIDDKRFYNVSARLDVRRNLMIDAFDTISGTESLDEIVVDVDSILVPLFNVSHQLQRLHDQAFIKVKSDFLKYEENSFYILLSFIIVCILFGILSFYKIISHVGDIIKNQQEIEQELNHHRVHLEEVVQDRTKELRASQEELVRKERLATLGQLTATISHELRNPLAAMKPSMYFIKKALDNCDDRVLSALSRIDRCVDRCDNIVEDLLDYTRIKNLRTTFVDFDRWLNEILEEYDLPEGIKLIMDCNLAGINVSIDDDRLRRSVINVVDNACHSMMDNEGKNVKNAADLYIMTDINNDRVELTVQDNGFGIPDGILLKIFEPLYSTKGYGVGLGLPIVKQIMQLHGGDIEVYSKIREGTRIVMWLPKSLLTEID